MSRLKPYLIYKYNTAISFWTSCNGYSYILFINSHFGATFVLYLYLVTQLISEDLYASDISSIFNIEDLPLGTIVVSLDDQFKLFIEKNCTSYNLSVRLI